MQTEAKQQPVPNFGDEEDYNLIGQIVLRTDDMVGAELAWQELYKRHFPYLFGVLKRGYMNVLDEMCLEDLATESLIRAFNKADSFERVPEATRQHQRRHIRKWLGTIAWNLLNSELQKFKGLKVVYPDTLNEEGRDGWEQIEHESSRQNDNEWVSRDPLSALQKQWIQEAFNTLDDREQNILRVTLEYERPDKAHQKLSKAVSGRLAEVHKTTPENVRQIRKRAKDKVKRYVDTMSEKYSVEDHG